MVTARIQPVEIAAPRVISGKPIHQFVTVSMSR
jgi:hypothetical protein